MHDAVVQSRAGPRWDVYVILVTIAVLLVMPAGTAWMNTFTTYFLAVLLEAIPFLLLGSILSAAVEVFLPADFLPRVAARWGWLGLPGTAVLAGGFPVCECGVVAVGRGLLHKGLPLPHAVVYLLAAPIFNPVVLFSTVIAFGYDLRYAAARAAGGLLVPIAAGLLLWKVKLEEVLLEEQKLTMDRSLAQAGKVARRSRKLRYMLLHARTDFLDMLPYLMFGVACAAGMQTFIGGRVLAALGQGPVSGPLAMMSAAFTLSLCSEADAFVAATFVQFQFPAVLAFMVFGPMLDIKLLLMYRSVFKPWFILRLSLCVIVLVGFYIAGLTLVVS